MIYVEDTDWEDKSPGSMMPRPPSADSQTSTPRKMPLNGKYCQWSSHEIVYMTFMGGIILWFYYVNIAKYAVGDLKKPLRWMKFIRITCRLHYKCSLHKYMYWYRWYRILSYYSLHYEWSLNILHILHEVYTYYIHMYVMHLHVHTKLH